MADEEIIVGNDPNEGNDGQGMEGEGYAGRSPIEGVFASEELEQRVASYLLSEIEDVEGNVDRADFAEQWQVWRRHRMARPAQKVKNFPWPNASNVCTPMTMSNTNAMYSKILGMLNKRKPRIKCTSSNPKYKEHGPVLARMLNKLNDSPFLINMPKRDQTFVYETVSMGTFPVEVAWKTVEWSTPGSGTEGGEAGAPAGSTTGTGRNVKKVYDGPMPEGFPLEKFLMWSHFENPDDAPWVAFKYRYTYAQLKQLAVAGFFDEERVNELLFKPATEELDGDKALQDVIGLSTQFGEDMSAIYDVYKVYVYADVDGKGGLSDVIGWFGWENQKFLRLELNVLPIRPISVLKYLPIPNTLYGMGVGWMSAPTQEEVDSIHNIRIDSMVLSSLQMFAKKKGAQIGNGEKLFPGKILDVDDPKNDIIPIGFRDVSGSTIPAETMARQYLDRSIGASEPMFGMADSIMKSGDTATGAMFRAQTSSSLLEVIFESFLDGYRKIYLLELMQLVANDLPARDMLMNLVDTEEDKLLLGEILDLDVTEIPTLFAFDIEITPSTQTEEAKRNGILMLTQLYSQMEQGLLQSYSLLVNPQTPPQVREMETKVILGKVALMEETLKMFGVNDTSEYLPYVENLRVLSEMMARVADQKTNVMKQELNTLPPVGSGSVEGGGNGMGDVGGLGQLGAPGIPGAMPGDELGGMSPVGPMAGSGEIPLA